MIILDDLRERFKIPYDCNYFRGIRISHKKENSPFFDYQMEIHIYKYDNQEDKYSIIVTGPTILERKRDFNKSSEEARKEIGVSLTVGLIDLEIREIIEDFLDNFYNNSNKFIKEDNRGYLVAEYTDKGEFSDDIIYGLEGFKAYMKKIIGFPVLISNALKVKDKDIEVSFIPIRDEMCDAYTVAKYASFYLLLKKKGEYLFNPLCDFLVQYKSVYSKILSIGSSEEDNEDKVIIKPYEDSVFKSYEEIVNFLEDVLEDNVSVLNCVLEILQGYFNNQYPGTFIYSMESSENMKDYEDILYLYGEKDWYAKEEIDFILMLNKNK